MREGPGDLGTAAVDLEAAGPDGRELSVSAGRAPTHTGGALKVASFSIASCPANRPKGRLVGQPSVRCVRSSHSSRFRRISPGLSENFTLRAGSGRVGHVPRQAAKLYINLI